jgi:molybdopterin-guanine dinucleotide biosynthesis protein A
MAIALNQPCLGVVLAGGHSSRMGQDKATLNHKQQNMLSFSEKLLQDVGVSEVIVSGKNHGIEDLLTNIGPLGGIHSIVSQFKPKALLILPVDLPLMNAAELSTLKRVGEISQKACFFSQHYLPLYLPINAFVNQFFEQLTQKSLSKTSPNNDVIATEKKSRKLKGPSIRSLLAQTPHRSISPKNNQSLFNANTPEQWQQATDQFSNLRNNYV